jgi:hypothetical protein
MGCMRMWRGVNGSPSEMIVNYQTRLSNGEHTIVLLLRHVDNLEDDSDVEVIIASSLDPPIIDAQRKFISGASFQVSEDPRWRSVLHGRIRNAVLTTDPANVVLRHPMMDGTGPRAIRNEWRFTQMRLRLTFQPDGSLQGVLGGYAPLYAFLDRQINAGVGTTSVVNLDCAAAYNTMKKLADGGRDPKTGQCHLISSAFEVTAVPAYISDRPPAAAAGARIATSSPQPR